MCPPVARVQRQHQHVAGPSPGERHSHGLVLIGCVCDPFASETGARQRRAQERRDLAAGPPAQVAREFLDHDVVGPRLRRDGGQPVDVRVLAIARLAEQQREAPVAAQVRVLTTHRAKGLEFDIVVLVELSRPLGQVGGQAVCVDRDSATDQIRAVFRGTNKDVRKLSPQLEKAYAQEKSRRLRDDLCALYVAMTRARHALHMIVRPLKAGKNGITNQGVGDQSAAALLRGALAAGANETADVGGDTLHTRGDQQWFAHLPAAEAPVPPSPTPARFDRLSLPAALAPAKRNWRTIAPSSLAAHARHLVSDLMDLSGDEGRQRGTLMHALFAQIGWLDDGVPEDDALRNAALATRLASDGAWLSQQIAAFRRMLTQPAIAEQLVKPPRGKGETVERWCEQSFAVRVGGELLCGTFDRVHVFFDGDRPVRAVVIDFKTDHVAACEDSLRLLVEQYRPQIDAYREALSVMLNLEPAQVSGRLLFVGAGRCCQV